MASVVEICNLALLRIGQAPIQTLDEASNEATYCRSFYDRCRKAALRAHPWNFSLAYKSLARLTTTPAEYAYAYALPADCLRALKIVGATDATPVVFQVRGRVLETDELDPVLSYISDADDPAGFDDQFIDCLSYRLAADLALPVTGNGDLVKVMYNFYNATLRGAREADMNEGHKPVEVGTSFIDARL